MFFASLQCGTLMTHSDYNIPGFFNSLQHDWHHYSYTENFGPVGIVDGILGTDKNFTIWLKELKLRDAEGWYTNGRRELADKTN
jgi:methylsterol monooxygenase